MNKQIDNIKIFRSLLELYLQKDFQFKKIYKYDPDNYHIINFKKQINEPHQILNGLYIVFSAIVLPLFLFFINQSWFRWFQISYFLSYVLVVLFIAIIFYWIQNKRKQRQTNLIYQMDESYKTLKFYYDNHPEILELYNNGQLELDDAELVETFQDKIKKREKMIQQLEKIIKNKN